MNTNYCGSCIIDIEDCDPLIIKKNNNNKNKMKIICFMIIILSCISFSLSLNRGEYLNQKMEVTMRQQGL
ncbi:unnamed protein product [Aphis gossypii]|uniref:Uncharacterized protein n=1 Tax=Aphis gossypii TaxID=80765 RepID=A0A9P0JB61_APHGO|nr:unnamed protein product [Aphis gossypii]CAH1736580.1 unnamed protein product [Aphis gossypii]